MPKPLALFLKSLITPQNYLPQDLFSMFEKSRLDLNERGTFNSLSKDQKQLIIGIFIFIRVLLDKILMKPELIVVVDYLFSFNFF